MTSPGRRQLYEKLYFHELDRREKIGARLTLPFGAILATAGLLSFMLNVAARPSLGFAFWLLFSGPVVALLIGAWFFRLAWFGHTDKLLPTADEIEKYHARLTTMYRDYDEGDALVKQYFDKFLFDYYVRDSSVNAINNDRRSYNFSG